MGINVFFVGIDVCWMGIGLYLLWVYIRVFGRSTRIKLGVERVNQERRFVKFVGYISLAGNRQ